MRLLNFRLHTKNIIFEYSTQVMWITFGTFLKQYESQMYLSVAENQKFGHSAKHLLLWKNKIWDWNNKGNEVEPIKIVKIRLNIAQQKGSDAIHSPLLPPCVYCWGSGSRASSARHRVVLTLHPVLHFSCKKHTGICLFTQIYTQNDGKETDYFPSLPFQNVFSK